MRERGQMEQRAMIWMKMSERLINGMNQAVSREGGRGCM